MPRSTGALSLLLRALPAGAATGMLLAAAGYLTPVVGAIGQEAIDLLAVLNALRAAWPPKELSDWHKPLPS